MGAGCNYTLHDDDSSPAYWLDVGYADEDDFDNFNYSDQLAYLREVIQDIPTRAQGGITVEDDTTLMYGFNYNVLLKSTHEGDGILIDLELISAEPIAETNYQKTYDYIIKQVNKALPLRFATSAWTSGLCKVGELQRDIRNGKQTPRAISTRQRVGRKDQMHRIRALCSRLND